MKDKIRYLSPTHHAGQLYDEWRRLEFAGTAATDPGRAIHAADPGTGRAVLFFRGGDL